MLIKLNNTVMLQDLMLLLAEHYFRISVTGAHVRQTHSFTYFELETGSALWNCTDMLAGRGDESHFFTIPCVR